MKHALVKDGVILEFRDYAPDGDQSKLARGKPRMLPITIDDPVFNSVTQVRSGPDYAVEATRVIERYTVRAKTADEVTAMRTAKIASVKDEAQAKICELIAGDRDADMIRVLVKEINAIARGLELTRKDVLTESEQAESDALEAMWEAVKAIRTRSNAVEATVPDKAAGIDAFDAKANW